MTDDPSLVDATDELFAGPPTAFVARRDELAKQARAAGQRGLAAEIKALRRPSVGAWYLNQASRAGLLSLRDLLSLGQELRRAQASGDFAALRALAARRGHLVSRVLRDLTAHLAHVGVTVTASGLDEVRATLAAALADPQVAAHLSAGRLDRPHTYSGFGDLDPSVLLAVPAASDAGSTPGSPAKPAPDAPAQPPEPVPDDVPPPTTGDGDAEQRTARERDARERLELLATARRELDDVQPQQEDLARRIASATAAQEAARVRRATALAHVDAERARLAAALAELKAAETEVTSAEDTLATLSEQERALAARVERARALLSASLPEPNPGRTPS